MHEYFVFRIRGNLLTGMNLILIGFTVLMKESERRLWSTKRISFSFSIFSLFSKKFWNKVVGFMTKIAVFSEWMFNFVILIIWFCKRNFRIWIIIFRKSNFKFQFPYYINNLQFWINSTIFSSLVLSSSSTHLTSVWNGFKRFRAVIFCFICTLRAKWLSFSGTHWVKKPLHLRLIGATDSLHRPFSTDCWTFKV